MNLIRFTFANIFDFKQVMDSIANDTLISDKYHASNSNYLQIIFTYGMFTRPIIRSINYICTPVRIEDLRE